MSARAIAAAVETDWRAYLEREQRPATPHRYVYASAWRECLRRMVYEMTVPHRQPPYSAELRRKFNRGVWLEDAALTELGNVGRHTDPPFRVVGQQERFELRDRKARPVIVGKVDARLDIAGVRAPLEVKAWAPQLVDRIERFEDLFENQWTRSGGYQLLSYLYGAAEPYGFMLLDRSGLPKLLPVELDANLDRVEAFLTRAEQALDHVEAGTLPDFLADEPDECLRCPFYAGVCNPPIGGGQGLEIVIDPALEAALERREQLKAAGKEFNDLDEELKARLRGTLHAVVGAFVVKGAWGKQSKLELPPALKKQYTTTNPKGRFTLSITKLG